MLMIPFAHPVNQSQSQDSAPQPSDRDPLVDSREQLFNGGESGPITDIQVSTERIAKLNGIFFDIDPRLCCSSQLFPKIPTEPTAFYETIAKPWLGRHPMLNLAEVRNSGTGLHVIVWLEAPLIFSTDQERQRWSGIVQVVQAVLPVDPDQPGITAVTRPIGSINSKNGATVTLLKPGKPVSAEVVVALYDEMRLSPFKTVMRILIGREKLKPCPLCLKEGSQLSAMDRVGQCYGSCGTVRLEQLYDLVLAPRATKNPEADHAKA